MQTIIKCFDFFLFGPEGKLKVRLGLWMKCDMGSMVQYGTDIMDLWRVVENIWFVYVISFELM